MSTKYGGYDASQDPRGYNKSERAKEMSKQEEILLKRKREIERKMKEKQSQPAPPSCPPPPSSNKPIKSTSSASNISNKFANDGSFLEQFKRFSQTSVKKEAEDDVLPPMERVQSIAPILKPQHAAFKEEDSESDSEKDENSGTKDCIKKEEDSSPWASEETFDEISSQSKEEQPDWFQDALKRAKEKAKLLTAPAQVSLSDDSEPPAKKRSSRWSVEPVPAPAPAKPPRDGIPVAQAEEESFQAGVCLNIPNNVMSMLGTGQHNEAIQGVFLTKLTRTNPAIIAYARRVFGSTDLTDAQWKQCEEQMKMNVVFQLLQARKAEAERLEQQGRVKYEYDSDEEVEGGTWEHRRRAKEMEDTKQKAEELTRLGEGKHHIGDFLPPEELARFVEKYNALKEGRDPDLSDYREHKLTSDNIGYRMLQSMGWTEGTGLGVDGKGITAPVNQNGRSENKGLGVERPDDLNEDDDEYDAYRKRMMLAYRFRPNPLNNPRRAYY